MCLHVGLFCSGAYLTVDSSNLSTGICLFAQSMTHKKVIEKELDGFGIRLNQKPPDIVFRKKDKGGLNYQETVPQVCFAMLLSLVVREFGGRHVVVRAVASLWWWWWWCASVLAACSCVVFLSFSLVKPG